MERRVSPITLSYLALSVRSVCKVLGSKGAADEQAPSAGLTSWHSNAISISVLRKSRTCLA
jgi:hypothetical protein